MSTDEYSSILEVISKIKEKFKSVNTKQAELVEKMDNKIKDTEKVILLKEAATKNQSFPLSIV
jgi:hypothetical protein